MQDYPLTKKRKKRIEQLDTIIKEFEFSDEISRIRYTIIKKRLENTSPEEIRRFLNEKLLKESQTLSSDTKHEIEKILSEKNYIFNLTKNFEKRQGVFSAVKKPDFLDAFLKYAPCPLKVYVPFPEWDYKLLQQSIRENYGQEVNSKYCRTALRNVNYMDIPLLLNNIFESSINNSANVYALSLLFFQDDDSENFTIYFYLFDVLDCSKVTKINSINIRYACSPPKKKNNVHDIIDKILMKSYDIKHEDFIIILPTCKEIKTFFYSDYFTCTTLYLWHYCLFSSDEYLKKNESFEAFYQKYIQAYKRVRAYHARQCREGKKVNGQTISNIFDEFFDAT